MGFTPWMKDLMEPSVVTWWTPQLAGNWFHFTRYLQPATRPERAYVQACGACV